MRLHGQAQADQMRMRSLIQSGIAEATGRVDALDSSLSAVAKSGEYADLSGKPTLGALASLDSITTTKISNWTSATSGFLTAASLAPYAKTADLATVATSGDYADLSGKPTIPVVPTVVSAFTNDAGYLTQHQSLDGYAKTADLATVATSGSYGDLSGKPTIPTVPTNVSAFANDAGYLTQHQSLTAYAKTADLAAVATSGRYADLTGKPTIPTVPTNVSAFSNDAGYLTQHQSLDGYAKTTDLGDLATLDTITTTKISNWASATSSFLTEHQDISGLLAKTGGTMSGTLVFDTDLAIRMPGRDGQLVVCGGNGAGASAGAKLTLYGRDHASAGGFILQAGNSSGYKQLKGDADGSLSWGGDSVVTSASLAPVEIDVTDAGYVTFAPLKVWRSGNVVTVYAYFTTPASVATSWTTAATGLPKPMQQIKTVAGNWSSSYARPVAVSVEADGTLKMVYGKASTKYSTTFSYVTSESA